jgi:hypothetical protein
MDRPEGLEAHGVLCAFAAFERWDGGRWRQASGVPGRRERIRLEAAETDETDEAGEAAETDE